MSDREPHDAPASVRMWAAVTVLGVVAGYVAVLLANYRHFYTDDTESQYVPLWVDIGRHLREGVFPGIVPEEWMAGNYLVEGQGSLFNPPQLLIGLIAPSVDNLVVLATVVKLTYSIILALGVFRVCRGYGAQPPWAAVAGVAFTFSGWVLFLDQATWVLALAGTAWLVHAWASAVRYARGRSGPIPVFVFLFLAITVGYMWPGIEAALMICAVAVGEVIHQRAWVPSLRVLLAAGCAGLAGLVTYLPGFLSSHVTWRDAEFVVKNDGFMTIPWSESLNASLPTTLPAFNSWFGPIQPFPVVYIAWFLIPALAFIDWRASGRALRDVSGAAIFALVALIWTAGPAAIGPLRWPVRVLPMLALGTLVVVCVLLSRHGTLRNWRTRGLVAVCLVGVLLARSIASAPSGKLMAHTVAALVVIALGALVLLIAAKRSTGAVCAVLIATVAPIAYFQVQSVLPHPMSWNLPERRSEAQAAFPDFEGTTTLQLGDAQHFPGDAKNLEGVYSALVVGFYAKDLELDYVNGYTPIGHYWFSQRLCMRWDGSTCPDAFVRAFEAEPSTGVPLVDLMQVDRVTLMRLQYPDAREQAPPPGWHWVDYDPQGKWIWVLERDGGPISTVNGRVSHTDGASATSVSETDYTSRVRVSSVDGGQVVFARLPWPGYRITLDGREIETLALDDIFLAADIPPGTTDSELVATWRPPGLTLGFARAAAGLAGIVILQVWYVRQRRPDAPGPEPAVEATREDALV